MATNAYTMVFACASLFLTNINCLAQQNSNIELTAHVASGLLQASVKNNSGHDVLLTDHHQSLLKGSAPGFYIDVRDSSGAVQEYCGMLDQSAPKKVLVSPKSSVDFSIDIWILEQSHCLLPGLYSVRVMYYSSDQEMGDIYLESNPVSIIVN